jgi:L-ascorbate metabolism protein UlaG (beta-lactamase superfamily)
MMKLTFYGHGCFGLETKGKHLVIDPFITPNPLAKDIEVDKIPCDYILLTHAHGDHIADVETLASRTGASIISNYEIVTYYESKGIKGHPMNIGGKFTFPFGIVKSTIAHHSSSFPDGTYGGNPGGFVIYNDEGSCYFAGDTALTLEMQLLPKICPPLNFAVLPIGDNFTMDSNDALIAAEFIDCKHIVGAHYDTFGYITVDKEKAKLQFSDKNKVLYLPAIGDTLNF